MTVEIDYERFDNGIVIKENTLDSPDIPQDKPTYFVAIFPNDRCAEDVGKHIMKDIDLLLDEEDCDRMKITITYEPIKDGSN